MRYRLILVLLMCLFPLAIAETMPAFDLMTLPFATGNSFPIGKDGWRLHEGDLNGFEKTDIDDSSWTRGYAGKSACLQGLLGKNRWILYRKSFTLPESFSGKMLLLDLGFISFYDEVYLDGIRIGGYGTYPKGISGSSWLRRRYVINKPLAPGKHLLAIRTFTGYASGMYNGLPCFLELKRFIYPRYILKEPNSLSWNISDASHLNQFSPGEQTVLHLQLTTLEQPQSMTFRASLVSPKKKTTELDVRKIELATNEWCSLPAIPVKIPDSIGVFSINLTLEKSDGTVAWKQTLYGRSRHPERFQLPVDASIANRDFPLDISGMCGGNFGPRHYKAGKLFYNPDLPDTRGGLAFSVRPMPNAPLVLMSHIKPMPKPISTENLQIAKGASQYDGLEDAWLFGQIVPQNAGKLKTYTIENNWTCLTFRYQYDAVPRFDFTISAISPAWRLVTTAKAVRIFDGIEVHGAGLPTLIAFEKQGTPVTMPMNSPCDTTGMSSNWFVVSFNTSKGFDHFDVPWLFVLQHRPQQISCAQGALEIEYEDEAGTLLGMPLYGVTLQTTSSTASWSKALPQDVMDRCRLWSQILSAAPESITRKAAVDFSNDTLAYLDACTHVMLNDDWKTQPLPVTPLPPLLSATMAEKQRFSAHISAQARDLDYATLHGPLLAVPGQKVATGIKGALHFVQEVHQYIPRNDEKSLAVSHELNALLSSRIDRLAAHPWKDSFWRGKYVPGNLEPTFTNLLLTLPYLKADLAEQLKQTCKKEVEEYVMFEGIPTPNIAEGLLPALKNRPVAVTMTTPNGLTLRTFAPQEHEFGTDSCCFEAQRCYVFWSYAYHCNDWSAVRKYWPQIKELANFVPNAHCWAIGCSYDTFSGLRVGNGLQETGIMHAGMCAVARMAQVMGDSAMRDMAGYCAAMQAISLCGAMSMNRYLRERRPMFKEHTKNAWAEYSEYYRNQHYVEFNETGGITPYVMHAPDTLNNPMSFIMTALPEVMRPYQELFSDACEDYFSPNYRHIPFNRCVAEPLSPDLIFNMTRKFPLSVHQLRIRRKNMLLPWTDTLNDLRVELDSLATRNTVTIPFDK